MNQYICGDLVDLRKSNKYTWNKKCVFYLTCYNELYDGFEDDGMAKIFIVWTLLKKDLIEMARNEDLIDDWILSREPSSFSFKEYKEKFKKVLEDFKKKFVF